MQIGREQPECPRSLALLRVVEVQMLQEGDSEGVLHLIVSIEPPAPDELERPLDSPGVAVGDLARREPGETSQLHGEQPAPRLVLQVLGELRERVAECLPEVLGCDRHPSSLANGGASGRRPPSLPASVEIGERRQLRFVSPEMRRTLAVSAGAEPIPSVGTLGVGTARWSSVDGAVPRYRPMLASSGLIRGSADDYAFEPKLDGWRVVMTVSAGRVQVRSRNGHDITASVPELGPVADALDARSVVLDGELVAHEGTPSSFYRLSGRMAARTPGAVETARRRTPATFVAFDLLWLDGDVTTASYRERRHLLTELHLQGAAWCTVSSFEGAGAELFAACTSLGLEGLIAKRLDGRYEPGVRSKTWIKAKCADWYEHHGQYRHAKR